MEPISLRKKSDYRDFPIRSEEHCPCVYLSGPKELAELPEEGTITFKFKRKTVTIAGSKDPVRVELDLISIENATEGEIDAEEDAAEDEMESGDVLDKLMASTEEELED